MNKLQRPTAIALFLATSGIILISHEVYAANQGEISPVSTIAISILALITLGLGIYLFWVILQPEKF